MPVAILSSSSDETHLIRIAASSAVRSIPSLLDRAIAIREIVSQEGSPRPLPSLWQLERVTGAARSSVHRALQESESNKPKSSGGRPPLLSPEEELQLAEMIRGHANRGQALTRRDVTTIVGDMITQRANPSSCSEGPKLPSLKWVNMFEMRHELVVRHGRKFRNSEQFFRSGRY